VKGCIVGLAIAAFAFTIAPAQPAAHVSKWHWVWMMPTEEANGWLIFQGDADVKFAGRSFDVVLDGDGGPYMPSLHLSGAISGGNIEATGTMIGTDASPERYTGTVDRARTKLSDASNGWGSDRITFRAGPTFIGLYRRVRSGN
jgi:hypothetical protein